MKFTCQTEHLRRALSWAERFTGKNTTLPILGNILLEAEGNILHITATNLESAIRVAVHGSGAKAGRVCIPAKIINSFLHTIGDEKVSLEERQGSLFIKTTTKETRMNGMPADDFPLIPQIKKTHSFSVGGYVFKTGLESVLPAVSSSEFKPELGGVYVRVALSQLRLAATDTFRLAEKTISFETPYKGDGFTFILPARAAQEVVRVLGDEEEVIVSIGESQAVFETDGMMIISRLTDGNFPDYSGIIPKNFESSCFAKRDDVLASVRASSIFASKLQEVSLNVSSSEMEIKSLNQDIGEYRNKISCAQSGKDVLVGFNYRYILDGLSTLHEDELFFGFNGEQAPSLIKNKSDGSFLYVVMPIHLS